MIKNVYKTLRKVLPYQEGDCISNTPLSSENASEKLESDCKEVIIPEGVSEPVISFVKCFKENPKRFEIREVSPLVMQVKDNVLGRTYKCALYSYTEHACNATHSYLVAKQLCLKGDKVLEFTHEEGRFLVNSLRNVISSRQTRYNHLLTQRKERSQKRLREKLTNIYRGDNNAPNK